MEGLISRRLETLRETLKKAKALESRCQGFGSFHALRDQALKRTQGPFPLSRLSAGAAAIGARGVISCDHYNSVVSGLPYTYRRSKQSTCDWTCGKSRTVLRMGTVTVCFASSRSFLGWICHRLETLERPPQKCNSPLSCEYKVFKPNLMLSHVNFPESGRQPCRAQVISDPACHHHTASPLNRNPPRLTTLARRPISGLRRQSTVVSLRLEFSPCYATRPES